MAQIYVPEGCALGWTEASRETEERTDREGDPYTHTESVTGSVYCACGVWAEEITTDPQSLDTQARSLWIAHLSQE